MSDKYRKTMIELIETYLEEIRRCHEHKGVWINDEIYKHCAAQANTLLCIIEVVEEIKVESYKLSLENIELRFKTIKE